MFTSINFRVMGELIAAIFLACALEHHDDGEPFQCPFLSA
jgi:hypothetical protein